MKNMRWFWLGLMVFPLAGLIVCYWLLTKANARAEAFTRENNPPITFYGKLEDQFGNALLNATVNFSIHVFSINEDAIEKGRVVSDGNGLFSISGNNGESLDVFPPKKRVSHSRQQMQTGSILVYGPKSRERIPTQTTR